MKKIFDILRSSLLGVISLMLVCCSGTSTHSDFVFTVTPSKTVDNALARTPPLSLTEITPNPTLTVTIQETPRNKSEPTPSNIIEPTSWNVKDDSNYANQSRVLLLDNNTGILWSGGPDGLVRWEIESGVHTQYAIGIKENITKVIALVQTSDNKVWIGTFGNGLSVFDGISQWKTYKKSDLLPSDYIGSLGINQSGLVWVDTSPYARDVDKGEPSKLGLFDGYEWLAVNGGGFFKIVASSNDTLWALAYPPLKESWEGVGYFNGKKWEVITVADHPVKTTAITIAPNGDIWLATKTEIFHFDGKTWNDITPPWIDNPDASVSTIEVTKEGIVWFGFSYASGIIGGDCGIREVYSEEIGVYRYDGNDWTHYTSEDGLVDNKICDITSGSDGSIWFGSYDKGISRFDGINWRSYIIP